MRKMTVDRQLGIHYGSIAFFSAILHNLFLLYHVEAFVSIYKIDKASFWIGETIFLVWNSCNDPLFGWLSDKKYLVQKNTDATGVVLGRLRALSWNGPLLALSFLTFWVSWINPPLQFVICLCLYDGFLTMVDLHHSALLADLTVSADTRTRLNFYSSVFGALGSLSVFLSYIAWSRDSLENFRLLCFVLAIISICGFIYATRRLKKMFIRSQKDEDMSHVSVAGSMLQEDISEQKALTQFVNDLSGHSNFIWFAAMNLVQVFHCHFNSNFFPLFLESLLGDDIPQVACSLILGLSFVAPHLNNLYFLHLCRKFGVYAVIRGLFCLKLFLSCLMLYMGPGHIWLLCIFIGSNRIFTEGTCKLLTLVISDLVDEDLVLHSRRQAVSALLFGTAALVSKPGQTLAPLIGTWLLAVHTGHDVFTTGNTEGSIKAGLGSMDGRSQEQYRMGVFQLLVYVPVVCGVLQLLAWSRFTLRGKRLRWVKAVRSGVQYATV